jgi:hypothetical protein
MRYTTYLLGAGASANAIPTYMRTSANEKNFTDQFSEFIYIYFVKHLDFTFPNKSQNLELVKRILQLRDEVVVHATIDTFAKKLFLLDKSNESDLLKCLVSLFLKYLQSQILDYKSNSILDYRYDVLFSTILEKSEMHPKIPTNIKFISWNYDNQIENTLMNFNRDISSIDTIYTKYSIYPRRLKETELSTEKIEHIKLNGHAGYYHTCDGLDCLHNKLDDPKEILLDHIRTMLKEFNEPGKSVKNFINFAWEFNDNAFNKKGINKASEIFKNTETLIIIGYSFPSYNYAVDKLLFSQLPLGCQILIQSKDSNSDYCKNKIKPLLSPGLLTDIVIEHTTYCDNFITPMQVGQYF